MSSAQAVTQAAAWTLPPASTEQTRHRPLPVRAGSHAGGRLDSSTSIDGTNAAQAVAREVGMEADQGNFNAQFERGIIDSCARVDRDFTAINGKGYSITHAYLQ
jgi:hypothetical protein